MAALVLHPVPLKWRGVRLTAQLMVFTVVHGFYWAIWKLKAYLCYVHSIHSLMISDADDDNFVIKQCSLMLRSKLE